MTTIRCGRVLVRSARGSAFGHPGIRTFFGSTSRWSDVKDGQGKKGKADVGATKEPELKELPASSERAILQAFWKVWKKKTAEKEGVQKSVEKTDIKLLESGKPSAFETKQGEVKLKKSESKKSEDHKSLEGSGRKANAKQGWALLIQRLQKKHQENPEMKARLQKTKNIMKQMEEEKLKKAELRRRSRETSEEKIRKETQRIMEIVKKIHDPKNKF